MLVRKLKVSTDAGLADQTLVSCSMTDWSSLVPQPANQKALLASRVFVRHYPHQGELLRHPAELLVLHPAALLSLLTCSLP
jgi:hypothetical protein